MGIRKILKSIGDYFNLQSRPAHPAEDFNFVLSAKLPEGGIGQSLKNYFDLYSQYRAGDKLMNDIMDLANAEGLAKGRMTTNPTAARYGMSFTEGDFSVKLEGDGTVKLKADNAFAEKVGKLASVKVVRVVKAVAPAAGSAKKVDGPTAG